MKQSTKSPANNGAPDGAARSSRMIAIAGAITFVASVVVPGITAGSDNGPDPVVATVGDHQVTQREVDNKAGPQLYQVRKQALDEIIDQYLVQKAAKAAGLKPDQYVERQLASTRPHVTNEEAKQYYQQHKAQLDARTGVHSFEQIQPRLIAALQHQHDQDSEEQLIEKLRKESHVNILLQEPRVAVASAGHPSTGAPSAPVTIVEFSDFQCPFCRAAERSLKEVQQKYGDRVRLVYIDFPLGFHPHALDAARAGRCAEDQNKFWQFHDALFANQSKLTVDDLKQTAATVGLDPKKFNACFAAGEHDKAIRQDQAQGNSLGVTGTPTFFINGRELVGAQPPPKFDEIIDEELARAKTPGSPQQAKVN